MAIFQTGRFDGKGWAVGHMAAGDLHTGAVEVKWAHQPKGDAGIQWRKCKTATTLSVLVNGRFKIDFRREPDLREQTVILEHPGAYVIFGPEYQHRSEALEDTLFLTIRWPSIKDDCDVIRVSHSDS